MAELLDRMSSREFAEWMAYYGIEPFGEERADLRQAYTTAAVTNLHMAQTKNPKWTTPADFMSFTRKRERPQPAAPAQLPPEVLLAKFNALTSGKRAT